MIKEPVIDVRSNVNAQPDPTASNPGVQVGGAAVSATPGTQKGQATTQAPVSAPAATTTKYKGIQTEIPAEFKASSYAELIPELEKHIQTFKPLSEDDLKKLRRKQRIEGIISGVADAAQSIANLYYTTQYAPNMYDAQNGMSAKAKARFDKDKAEREANADKFFNYSMQIGRMKDVDRQTGLQAWQTEQTMLRQDRAYDDTRADRAEDVAFRNKDYDERVRQWQENFNREGEWHKEEAERWEKQFNESIRQFNVSSSMERSRLGMEAQRLAHAMKEGQMTFNLGSGNGNVTLSMDKLNAANVSRIYETLPAEVREKVHGKQIIANGYPTGQYEPPTTEAMLVAIGANVEKSPVTQNAIRQVAGLETGEKPKGY